MDYFAGLDVSMDIPSIDELRSLIADFVTSITQTKGSAQ
jgi:hypothetical protein